MRTSLLNNASPLAICAACFSDTLGAANNEADHPNKTKSTNRIRKLCRILSWAQAMGKKKVPKKGTL